MNETTEEFLKLEHFVVAGASTNREKYGNKILRCYLQNDYDATPMNPRADEIEGRKTVAGIGEIANPETCGLSIITPPKITEAIVEEAIRAKIAGIWMQPGAESQAAIDAATNAGIPIIHSGPCLLVVVGFRDV